MAQHVAMARMVQTETALGHKLNVRMPRVKGTAILTKGTGANEIGCLVIPYFPGSQRLTNQHLKAIDRICAILFGFAHK